MKAIFRTSLCCAIALVVLAGCAGTPANFANHSVTDRSQIDLTQGKKITASASGFQLALFIPIAVNGRHQRAYDALIEKAGDSALSDIFITESWTYAVVGTVYTTSIEATAYPRLNPATK